MSANRLREAARVLRERAEVATPGPWTVAGPYKSGALYLANDDIGATVAKFETPRRDENVRFIATLHPGVALALADLLDAEAAGDGYLPHRYPKEAPAEVIAWKCQACGDVIREMYGPTTTCTVDWRPRNPLAVAVADEILGTP